MSVLSLSDLKHLLAAAKSDAMSAIAASKLSAERSKALDYYLGDMSADMPAPNGRSQAVSTDVSDTIEGLMPTLMDIFCGGDEIVRFEPVGPEDVQAAEQESDYVNHVFMQQNQGFLILYSFVKDALLSKNGIVKVWWERKENYERETYFDQSPDAFASIIADHSVEVIAHTEHDGLHDVTVETSRIYECARVEGVPPEEFGIARHARSIQDADYCFHEVIKSEAKLIEQGYEAEQIKRLPPFMAATTIEAQARDTVEEGIKGQGQEGLNKSARLIKVTEHYIRMDYEANGKPRLYRVTTGGDEGEVLIRGGEPAVTEEDAIPFATMTPIIVTHRFFGRSIADLVMDIQRIKTALLRALLDNAYMANNPRPVVAENETNESTLDDLLLLRHGAPIRAKTATAVMWQQVPSIGDHLYPAMQYMDATREWRTGVSRQGQGTDPNALQNQVATIANHMFNAAQAKVKLIARIFAETGVRDLFSLLHMTIRKNGSRSQTVRLRNQWVTVDPREWKNRNDMTINVGLGTGGKSEQLAHMLTILGLQKEALAGGLTNLVDAQKIYNAAKEVTKLVGLKDADRFFNNPAEQPAPNIKLDPKLIELQMKNEIERTQAQADIATENNKIAAESALAQQKFEHEAKLAWANFELTKQIELLKADLLCQEHALSMTAKRESHAMSVAQSLANAEARPQASTYNHT